MSTTPTQQTHEPRQWMLFRPVGGGGPDPRGGVATLLAEQGLVAYARETAQIADYFGAAGVWLHNPGGIHDDSMLLAQYDRARDAGWTHLTQGVREAVDLMRGEAGREVHFYVGQLYQAHHRGNTTAFVRRVLEEVSPYIEAGVDGLHFDATPYAKPGTVEALDAISAMGVRVGIEPLPHEAAMERYDTVCLERYWTKHSGDGQVADRVMAGGHRVQRIVDTPDSIKDCWDRGHMPLVRMWYADEVQEMMLENKGGA